MIAASDAAPTFAPIGQSVGNQRLRGAGRSIPTFAGAGFEQAAAGNYDQARQTAAEAIEWAKRTDQIPLAEQIEARLELYRNGKPIQEEGDAKLPGL